MKFMNLNKWLYSNPQDKAGDGEQGGGDAGGDNGGEDKPLTFANQAELDAYIKAQAGNNGGKDDDQESLFDKRQKQQQQQQQQQEQTAAMQAAVYFDTTFDGFIAKNAKYFPDNVKSIRDDVTTTDVIEKSNLIAATAAKEFFSKKENLESLTDADKKLVESDILGVRFESKIDGVKAWELVQRSIHGHELMNKHNAANNFNGKNGNGETGFAHVDKFTSNWFPKSVVSVNP